MQNQDPKVHGIALDSHPDVAKGIGLLLSCISIVEHDLPHLLSKITGVNIEHASTILGINRLETNFTLFEMLSKAESTPEPFKSGIAPMFKRLRAVNAMRSKYAHATYADAHDHVVMVSYMNDVKKPKKSLELITGVSVELDVAEARAALFHLNRFVHQGIVPPMFVPLDRRNRGGRPRLSEIVICPLLPK